MSDSDSRPLPVSGSPVPVATDLSESADINPSVGASGNPMCDAIFRRGFSHHARGEHETASAFYEWLMELEPDAARSWHWYGVIKLEQGDAQAALNFISKAVTLDATDATVFLNLGNCMQALDLHEQAVAVYELAITLRKDYGSAWFNLGNLLSEMGQTDAALSAFDAAVNLNANAADAWCNRGNLLKSAARFDEAVKSYDEALRFKPDDPTVWSNRGLTFHEMGRYEQAIADFDQALLLRPAYVNALCNKGNSLRALKRSAQAMGCYDDALLLDADNAQAHCNRGLLLRELREVPQAMASFNEAIRCNPRLAQAYSNRALMHKAVGDYDASMRDQLTALEIDPLMADAHTNMGALYHDLNRIEEAIVCHRRAIAISPQHPQANWNLSLDLILTGQMQEGWKLYEWRLHRLGKGMSHQHHGRPRLQPQQDLKGLTVLLTHEQGFGDTLQFCRFALVLKAAGANVLFEAPATLHAVLRSLYENVHVFEEDACDVAFDVWCPLLSLPLTLQMQMDAIPNWSFYLGVNAEKSRQWEVKLQHAAHDSKRKRLTDIAHSHGSPNGQKVSPADWLMELTQTARQGGRRMRIGLCVSGNPQHENTHNRDMPLGELLAALPDCHDYVMLQKRISDDERGHMDATGLTMTQWSEQLDDFSDTAALCSCMDLIISVDTSVAHLAAAIGCPTWILLPWVPDWRWMMQRDDSPWYPTVRLFRQDALKDWSGPIGSVGTALESICPDEGEVLASA